MIRDDSTATILVDRLRAAYWPDVLRDWSLDKRQLPPIDYVQEWERDLVDDYHRRRVLFFVEQLSRGEVLDPILLVCQSSVGVINGFHRFTASVLAGAPTIEAEICSGHYSKNLDWLTGDCPRMPAQISPWVNV